MRNEVNEANGKYSGLRFYYEAYKFIKTPKTPQLLLLLLSIQTF